MKFRLCLFSQFALVVVHPDCLNFEITGTKLWETIKPYLLLICLNEHDLYRKRISKGSRIGHFRVAVNLIMKARLSAKLFIRKCLFAYELHLASPSK